MNTSTWMWLVGSLKISRPPSAWKAVDLQVLVVAERDESSRICSVLLAVAGEVDVRVDAVELRLDVAELRAVVVEGERADDAQVHALLLADGEHAQRLFLEYLGEVRSGGACRPDHRLDMLRPGPCAHLTYVTIDSLGTVCQKTELALTARAQRSLRDLRHEPALGETCEVRIGGTITSDAFAPRSLMTPLPSIRHVTAAGNPVMNWVRSTAGHLWFWWHMTSHVTSGTSRHPSCPSRLGESSSGHRLGPGLSASACRVPPPVPP